MGSVLETCNECGCSVAFGSGNYVNRVPADDGWLCPECLAIECDECGVPSIDWDHPSHDDTAIWCVDCLDKQAVAV